VALEDTDLAVEPAVRERELGIDAGIAEDLVPPAQAFRAVVDVVVLQDAVQRDERRHFDVDDPPVGRLGDRRDGAGENVVVRTLVLTEAALQSGRVVVGRVRRSVAAEEVERDARVQVQEALDRRQVDPAVRTHIVGVVLAHELGRALHDALDARRTDGHVVRLLLQHERRGARQRVERTLAQRRQLELPVTVGEVGEHEHRQPVRGVGVERLEDARTVDAARVALEQPVGLVAPLTSEVRVQQVHHRPQMASLFDVDLEQAAEVVQARSGVSE
jgi:hypothetical protein